MSDSPQADWYEHFFSGAALDVWRQAVSSDATKQEAAFLAEALSLPEGSSVLDAPCGNGRLSLPLALAGYKITGVDFCAPFIDEAKQSAKAHKAIIEYIKADVRDFATSSKFDGAFCMGNSFGYFDRKGTVDFFISISKCLNPGAMFVLDSAMAAECFFINGGEREWVEVGDVIMLIENKYNCRLNYVETEYTFIKNGREEKRKAVHWIYTAGEVGHMLEQADFTVRNLFSSPDFDDFTLGADRLLLVAEKKQSKI